jgi:hypothetical protein
MLHSMRTEDVGEFPVFKRQIINILDLDEIRNIGMPEDIGVDAAAVSHAAADIQIPFLPEKYAFLQDGVTEVVESIKHED